MHDTIAESLKVAIENLLLGVKLSKQSSYARRAPEPDSLPHFGEASRLLKEVLQQCPDNLQALSMMSQVSECLLDYAGAAKYLNRALEVGEPRTKKTLKRLALLRDYAEAWRDLSLSPKMVRDLGKYLEAMCVGPNHRTMDITRAWLLANWSGDAEEIIAALERRGAFSDFQVLANIVYG